MRKLTVLYRSVFRKVCSLAFRKGTCHPLRRTSAVSLARMGNFFSNSTDLPQSASLKMVEETVSQNCVVIYSKTTCPYCKMAKDAFSSINVSYKNVELDEVDDGRQLQEALHQLTGARTVPRVFVNGVCIGGGTETCKLNQDGKLLELVQQCNITTNGS